MTSRFMLIFAAISGFIFVALGAFGAHVLSKTMGVAEMGWIHTGLQYQAFHTLAILAGGGDAAPHQHLVLLEQRLYGARYRSFSGSLYCLALAFTPVGVRYAGWGVCFLAGWILMLIGAIRLKRKGVVHE